MTSNRLTSSIALHNTRIPRFIYGTAWKEDDTESLTLKALHQGFTGIDTANQRKHYLEAGVGNAVHTFMQQTDTLREALFLQTKFTFLEGQDSRLPYDPKASYTTQVQQSFDSSLQHLGTDYLDAYLLHGPSQNEGLSDADFEVWHAMEALYRAGKVKLLGVSNVSAHQLECIRYQAAIQPTLVQNRCFAATGWDRDVRHFCHRHHMLYQGFSLLTANTAVLKHPEFQNIVTQTHLSPAQVLFQALLQLGVIVLTGTSSQQHMMEDLDCLNHALSDDSVQTIEALLLEP